jgi:hypothetical protein
MLFEYVGFDSNQRRHCERQRSNPDEGYQGSVWIASSLRQGECNAFAGRRNDDSTQLQAALETIAIGLNRAAAGHRLIQRPAAQKTLRAKR